MKISELIDALIEIEEEHGDVEVDIFRKRWICGGFYFRRRE